MSAAVYGGPRRIVAGRDKDGYREYRVTWLVRVSNPGTEGPASVMTAAGLPIPGSMWAFGLETDPWVWCRHDLTIEAHEEREGDPIEFFRVTQLFSNRPEKDRCGTSPLDDPLLEPQKVSGSFVRFVEEAVYDRFSGRILSSSHEPMRGKQNEWDASRMSLRIEQNVLNLELGLLASLVDSVNAYWIWGLPPRTVKLSTISWEKKYHGQCYVYYTRTLEFDIRMGYRYDLAGNLVLDTWDRDFLDEGTKALTGYWDTSMNRWILTPVAYDQFGGPIMPDPHNPLHFDRYKDKAGENARVVLDGFGLPFDPNPELDWWWIIENSEGVALAHYGTWTWTKELAGTATIYGPFYWEPDVDDYGPDTSDPETWGRPQEGDDIQPGIVHVEKYFESDLLLLGVPTTL